MIVSNFYLHTTIAWAGFAFSYNNNKRVSKIKKLYIKLQLEEFSE